MTAFYRKIFESIRQGRKVALAMVISRNGSLPMSRQAKMLVFEDGSIFGTIGGGKLEADIISEARHVLSSEIPKVVCVNLTSSQVEEEGMICGGAVKIFIDFFDNNYYNLDFFEKIDKAIESEMRMVVCTAINLQKNNHFVFISNEKYFGTFKHKNIEEKLALYAANYLDKEYSIFLPIILTEEEAKKNGVYPQTELHVFFDKLMSPPTVYLFGGGHISLYLAKLLVFIDFDFVIIDDREKFANKERFPEAKDVIVDNFERVNKVVSGGVNSYFVIVTRGHKYDLLILKKLIDIPAKYIGMIGSRRKIDLFFQHLEGEGVKKEQLVKIHAPIGLPIAADTPEEIAVSIAAELIKIRRSV